MTSEATFKADCLGLDLLDDGRVAAVALSGCATDRPPVVVFARVFDSVEQLAGQVRAGHLIARRVNLALPRHKFIVKDLRLPSVEPAEVRSMLDFESAGLIPLGDGQNVRAFLSCADCDAGYTDVCLFITPNAVIEGHLAPLRATRLADLTPDRVIASPLALWAWHKRLARVMPAPDPDSTDKPAWPDGCVTLVAADPDRIEVVAVAAGSGLPIAHCRSVASEPSGAAAIALEQATRSLATGADDRSATNAPVVLLVPGAPQRDALVEEFRQAGLWAQDCPLLCHASESAAALARAAGAAAIESCAGLADFNMLVGSLAAAKRRTTLRRRSLMAAAMAIALIGLLVGGLRVQEDRQQRLIEELTAEIEPIRQAADQVNRKRELLIPLQGHVAGRGLPLAVLSELYRLTPTAVQVVELNFDGNERKLTILAQAPSASQAYQFRDILMRSDGSGSPGLFRDARVDRADPISRATGTVTEFTCICRVGPVDAVGRSPAPATQGGTP